MASPSHCPDTGSAARPRTSPAHVHSTICHTTEFLRLLQQQKMKVAVDGVINVLALTVSTLTLSRDRGNSCATRLRTRRPNCQLEIADRLKKMTMRRIPDKIGYSPERALAIPGRALLTRFLADPPDALQLTAASRRCMTKESDNVVFSARAQ